MAGASATVSRAVELEPRPEIGRYIVIDEIGAGGMGRVYRAYDPKLGREVALKRLRLSGDERSATARMLREAKAMALLSHPNVVPVYDVDVDGGTLFIAMEYVRGSTLDAWLLRHPPDWRGVIAMFVQAGRGLAAAHAQGLVHRDFKPSNVVVGEEGRPRVMDFGLARAVGDALAEPMPDALVQVPFGNVGDLGATLTADGTVVGTPRYMAPEQHLGDPVDARTDQYGFCVALWEALYRKPAFTTRSITELGAEKLRGAPKSPAGTKIPASVHAIVARGMSRDPALRWPDMGALLGALEGVTAPRARRWLVALVPVAAAAVLGAWSMQAPACGDGDLDELWNDGARTRVEQAMLATGASYAASTAQRVVAALDGHASAWRQMHVDACTATNVRHEQSDEAFDLRMACLQQRRRELGDTIELLATADADVVSRAIEVVAALPPLAPCADVATLRERTPPADRADVREAVEDVRAELARARLQTRAGKLDLALATARAAHAVADASGYEPIAIEAETEVGSILVAAGRFDDAVPLLERAYDAALASRNLHAAAAAGMSLAHAIKDQGASVEQFEWLVRAAMGMAEGDGTDPILRSQALAQYGGVLIDRTREVEAEVYVDKAVDTLAAALGPDHPELIPLMMDQALLARALERREEARDIQLRMLEIAEKAYGPDHPEVADPLRLMGLDALVSGRGDDANALYSRVAKIYEDAYGPRHAATIDAQVMRANALGMLERKDEALAIIEQTLEHMNATHGETHPSFANTLHNIANFYGGVGEVARSVELFREVVRVRRAIGQKSVLASSLSSLAMGLERVGRPDEAETVLEEVIALENEIHADDGVYQTQAHALLAAIYRRRGEHRRALELLQAALARVPAADGLQHVRARWELGKLLWDLDVDRPRAVAMVAQSHDRLAAFDAPGDEGREAVAEMKQWLDTHTIVPAEDPFAD